MVFPSDKIGLYLDWRTQEVGIAAALSGDAGLRAAYESGDVYHKAAFDAGLTTDPDRKHWAKSNPDFRNRMKTQQLGINYGMGVTSLAKGLQRHPVVACDMIEKHKRAYPRFWEWRQQQVEQAKIDRYVETVFGWPLHLTHSTQRPHAL